MKKNYEAVPQWWFYSLLIIVVALTLLTCEGFGKQLQLPYWGVLLAVGLALMFTLPVGVLAATTNQQPELNVITELIIGYMYPGRLLANVTFKNYGYTSMSQAISFLSDFKLGHYILFSQLLPLVSLQEQKSSNNKQINFQIFILLIDWQSYNANAAQPPPSTQRTTPEYQQGLGSVAVEPACFPSDLSSSPSGSGVDKLFLSYFYWVLSV
ncbi:PREDICTED: oligopeptide transporter 1-like, partial [Populus euphratica]|uniref:Oligopeptide transporter 1-like n=1 Tax=Populus euphratica TaxID=75702 RepID=A0AAJ6TT50_POPEU